MSSLHLSIPQNTAVSHPGTAAHIYSYGERERERDGEVPHSFSDPLFPLSCASVFAEGLPKRIFRRNGHMTVNRVEENVKLACDLLVLFVFKMIVNIQTQHI